MKKKLKKSVEALSGQLAADYEVGQVSGSLFKKKSAASGSLSTLFSTAAPTGAVLFQPPPKPVQKSTEAKERQKETPEVKVQSSQTLPKQKSDADQQLENREISLQNADEDERGKAASARGKKRKVPEAEEEEAEAGNSTEHWVLKRQKLKAQKEEEAIKNKRTVFVGNLPPSCTKKMLCALFKDYGSIDSIRFRSVAREDPGMSRKVAVIQRKVHPQKTSVNAYVVFSSEDAVALALERNGLEIQKDFHIRVDKVADGSRYDNKRSVFVGNLSFEMNELAIRQHFEDCGKVEAVRLVRDQDSGFGKGFGYVLFESSDSVQLALELDGTKLDGRPLRVRRAEKQTNKGGGRRRTGKGPVKGPVKGPERAGRKNFTGNQQNPTKSSTSFRGEMVDPNKKSQKKVLKKKKRPKPKKRVHI
uniref:RNA binding motif protein 34 n=1 Tax=Gasterosteus aculeatus aculeatus TaxID=481459 RepID=A0AAQ4QWK9_GASAC